ncbi:MAG: hypothetical protein ACTSV6_05830 [Candidatus Heimdallarchaeota archaeon]
MGAIIRGRPQDIRKIIDFIKEQGLKLETLLYSDDPKIFDSLYQRFDLGKNLRAEMKKENLRKTIQYLQNAYKNNRTIIPNKELHKIYEGVYNPRHQAFYHVEKLIKGGYVRKLANPLDKRQVLLEIDRKILEIDLEKI